MEVREWKRKRERETIIEMKVGMATQVEERERRQWS